MLSSSRGDWIRTSDHTAPQTRTLTGLSYTPNCIPAMKEKIAKTNVARLLDKAKIAYELIPYEVDENDLSAVHVAASLGENIEQVFKTLVLQWG